MAEFQQGLILHIESRKNQINLYSNKIQSLSKLEYL